MNHSQSRVIAARIERRDQSLHRLGTLLAATTALLLLVLLAQLVHAAPAPTKVPAKLAAFQARESFSRHNLSAIEQVAEMAAQQILAHPGALVNAPYGVQPSFAEEVMNRSGCLSVVLPPEERAKALTPNDVDLISARSWEEDKDKVQGMLKTANEHGWKTILFASKAGMPADIKVTALIDNGASSGAKDEAPVNALANIMNVWLWTCEYTAAMSRQGKYPGILMSIMLPGAEDYDKKIQAPEGRNFIGDTKAAIPAGQLAEIYLKRVDSLMATLASEGTQSQIDCAADVITRKLAEGKTVGVATCTHLLMSEIFENRKTPMKPFNAVWQAKDAFGKNLKAGDAVLWFGYIGVRTPYEDYATPMRATGAEMITSYVTDLKNPENNETDAACQLPQHWNMPDAEVPLPFPPGNMAPVSSLDQGLLYRMLEDEVAARLAHAP
jgi:hypothetical protein